MNVDVEIIIIDDGSTDNSYTLAQTLARADSRIKSVKNNNNIGFCKTVNKGLSLAKGEYIVVLDQDDLLEKSHCESSLNLFDDDTAMVFNDHYLIDGNGVVFDKEPHCLHRELFFEDFISGNKIPVPGLIISREKILSVGGYPELQNYPNYGEYHTWIRLAKTGRIKFNPSTIALYRRHNTNMTNSFNDKSTIKKLAKYSVICKRQMLGELPTIKKMKLFFSLAKDYKKILLG